MLFDEVGEAHIFEKEQLMKNVENINSLQAPIQHPIILTKVKGNRTDDDGNPLSAINLRSLMKNDDDFLRRGGLGL